jgi:hypothetical protein
MVMKFQCWPHKHDRKQQESNNETGQPDSCQDSTQLAKSMQQSPPSEADSSSTGQEMKLYNDQPNAQVFNLLIYLLLPYMFRAFF